MGKSLKEKIIENIVIEEIEQPTLSIGGSFLMPFRIYLNSEIIEDDELIEESARRIISSLPQIKAYKPTVFGKNNFSEKVYKHIKQQKPLKEWDYISNINSLNDLNYVFLLIPQLSETNELWRDSGNIQIPYEKKGLIAEMKRKHSTIKTLHSIYADETQRNCNNCDKEIIPNININSISTLNDLSDILPKKWNNNREQFSLDYLRNAKPEEIDRILNNDEIKTKYFIEKYRESLMRLNILDYYGRIIN